MDAVTADVYRIRGGTPLVGCVTAAGSKNASLPIMAAALLATEPVQLTRVPHLADVQTMLSLLRSLGSVARRTKGGAIEIEPVRPLRAVAPARYVERMRASFCVLGPLLACRGRAVVPLPGGCRIGPRPVDLHLRGLAALRADIEVRSGIVWARARSLRGATIDLAGPRGTTVTGTANVLMAATRARGTSILYNAATEPEIVDLGRFLQALGAQIEGLGTPTLVVRGVEQLGGGRHTVIADRIEAATLLIAGAATRGDVTVDKLSPDHLTAVLDVLRAAGATVATAATSVRVTADRRPQAFDVTARAYPGVPTDVQAQLTVLAATALGRSRIADTVFPQRFAHARELARLGASIDPRAGAAQVTGRAALAGGVVTASDLRASAALVLAGLAARGVTTVRRLDHLDRGYEGLATKLRSLGADVRRLRPHARGPSSAAVAAVRPAV